MGLDRHEARELSFPEDRSRHGDVVQVVAVARVGIVVDEDIALAKSLEPPVGDGRLNGEPEVTLEDRQPDALRDHLHVGVEDRTAEVEALADDVVVRGLDHRDPHALGGGIERSADNLDRYVVDRGRGLQFWSTSGERCSLRPTPPIASTAFR